MPKKKKETQPVEEPQRSTVILSIRPAYAEKIFDQDMQYIFQKRVFTREQVDRVLLYTPKNGLLGEFTPGEVYSAAPSTVWRHYSGVACMRRKDFMQDFGENDKVHAIEVNDPLRYKNNINPAKYIEGFKSPTPFVYVTEMPGELEKIIQRKIR